MKSLYLLTVFTLVAILAFVHEANAKPWLFGIKEKNTTRKKIYPSNKFAVKLPYDVKDRSKMCDKDFFAKLNKHYLGLHLSEYVKIHEAKPDNDAHDAQVQIEDDLDKAKSGDDAQGVKLHHLDEVISLDVAMKTFQNSLYDIPQVKEIEDLQGAFHLDMDDIKKHYQDSLNLIKPAADILDSVLFKNKIYVLKKDKIKVDTKKRKHFIELKFPIFFGRVYEALKELRLSSEPEALKKINIAKENYLKIRFVFVSKMLSEYSDSLNHLCR